MRREKVRNSHLGRWESEWPRAYSRAGGVGFNQDWGLPGKYADMTEGKGSEDVCKEMPIIMDHGI